MSFAIAGTIGGALIGANAASKASKRQAAAADRASELQAEAAAESNKLQREMWEKQQANQKPWLDAGQYGLTQMQAGLKDGRFTKSFSAADFTADPGYQWRVAQGTKAIERQANARGSLASGRTLKALSDYTANQATNTWTDARNAWNQDNERTYNRYASLAGVGQTATNQLNSMGSQYAANVSNNSMNAANNMASNTIGAGNAAAAGSIATGNAITGGINNYLQYQNYQSYLNKVGNGQGTPYNPGVGVPIDTSGNGWY